MAIKNYIRPRLEVYQLLEVTRQATGDHLAACIVGPTYDLYRDGVEDVPAEAFAPATSSTFDLAIDTHVSNHYELDVDSVELNVDGLRAAVSSSISAKLVPDTSNPMTLRFATAAGKYLRVADAAYKNDLATELAGRNVEVGDILYLSVASSVDGTADSIDDTAMGGTGDIAKHAAVVTDLVPAVVYHTPNVAWDNDGTWEALTGNAGKPEETVGTFGHSTAVTGAYTGSKDTSYIVALEKVGSGSSITVKYTVTDTVGVDTATSGTVTPVDGVISLPVGTLGLGLMMNPSTDSDSATTVTLRIGAQAPEESATLYDGVKVKAMPYTLAKYNDILTNFTTKRAGGASIADSGWPCQVLFAVEYSGVLPKASELTGSNTWEVIPSVNDATGDILGKVSLSDNIFLKVAKDYYDTAADSYIKAHFVSGIGTVHPSYRVLTYPVNTEEEMYTIYGTEDIQKYFGTIDPLNPLAYGCQVALDGAAGREIFAVRTQGLDATAFRAAVKKTESTSDPYSFVPLSHDIDAIRAVTSFNQDMSEPEVKKWRRTIVGVQPMQPYELTTLDKNGRPLQAVVLNNAEYGSVYVQIASDIDYNLYQIPLTGATTTTLHAGDMVRFDDLGQTFEVDDVISYNTIALKSGPSTEISTPKAITLIKASNPDNMVEYVGSYAGNFGNRRVTTVWTDNGYLIGDDTVTAIDNMYLACEVAGLSSSVVPQQSITHSQITSVNSIPRMYTQYSQNELDKIASQGVLVVTQDSKGGYVYIRHALTTETDKGNLYYEDMCTRNIDNISYAIVDMYEPYIGRANVTPSALRAIKRDISNLLLERQSNSPSDLLGPQLVKWDGLEVYQDPTYRDCVVVKVNLYLPLPLNRIRVYEMAYIANVTIDDTSVTQ